MSAAGGRMRMAVAAVGVGAAAGLVSAVSKAGEYDKTMRMVAATTRTSAAEMQEMSRLALKMGADTTFSASDASRAMLELAKGGLSAAQIRAGALQQTLTLAAAGGLDLGNASTYMVQGLTTFGLRANQAGEVAAALAGAANASTASVESMGQALSQVGPAAKLSGLTIQETTAALAAFDNAGIKGSDAGTSLKTMLLSLVPTTKSAADAMKAAGFSAVDSSGRIKNLEGIAQSLQNTYGRMSAPERIAALKKAFGTDAFRAAAILSEMGARGISKFTKATSDQKAASDLARVGTEGYAGALEQFKGSVETLQVQVGAKLLPALAALFRWLAQDGYNAAVRFGTWFAANILPTVRDFAGFVRSDVVPALRSLGGWIVRNQEWLVPLAAGIGAIIAALKVWRVVTMAYIAVQTALNVVLAANPIGLVVLAIVGLTAAIVTAYKRSETFRNIVDGAFRGIAATGRWMWERVLRPAFRFMAQTFLTVAGSIVNSAAMAFGWIPGLGPKLRGAANDFNKFAARVNRELSPQRLKNRTVTISVEAKDILARNAARFAREHTNRGGGGAGGGSGGAGVTVAATTAGLSSVRNVVSNVNESTGELADDIVRKLNESAARNGQAPDYTGRYVFPLPRGSYRVGGGIGSYPGHTGQDFPAPTGTPVFAPFSGYFRPVNLGNRSYGRYANLVAGAMRFIGAHLSGFARGAGLVRAGETLGYVGSTGNSTGPHLHAEFRRGGVVVNPRTILQYAKGTLSAPPGFALVGEQGPELVRFRGGERVYPNRQSMNMLTERPAPQVVYNGTIVVADVDELMRKQRASQRDAATMYQLAMV